MLIQPALLNLSKAEVMILEADNGLKIEHINDLSLLVKTVCSFVGIKELPDMIVLSACWKTLDHFRSFTKNNFIQAFEFNEAGIYENRSQHYNAFLPAYMSDVLNNYRSIRNKAQSDYKKQLKALEPEPEPTTPEQCYNGLIEFVKEHGEPPRFWDWNKSFQFMEESGLIQMTLEEKNQLFSKVKADIEKMKSVATDLRELIEINKQLAGDNLIKECRRIAVINSLKTETNDYRTKRKERNEIPDTK